MKHLWLIFILLHVHILSAEWINFRNSAVTIDGTTFLRYETFDNHSLNFYHQNEWIESAPNKIGQTTYETELPFDNNEPLPLPLPLSFRTVTAEKIELIPGIIDHENPSSQNQMNKINEHERKEDLAAHLNIASEAMVVTEDKLFFSMSNFGDGFEIRDDTFGPFYSYSINLWHKQDENPEYVYSLIYTVDLPPFISSGLYKIKSEDDSMEKIAEINFEIDEQNNTLYLSCSKDDLLAENSFAEGIKENNYFYLNALTQKIENFGQDITIMDQTDYNKIIWRDISIHPFDNSIPQISDIKLESKENPVVISLKYYDNEGHFPIIAELTTSQDRKYHFQPQSFDFSEKVNYICIIEDNWSAATIKFSDNGIDFITEPIKNVNVEHETKSPTAAKQIYPNPFIIGSQSSEGLMVEIDTEVKGDIIIELMNVKGQKIYLSENRRHAAGTFKSLIPSGVISSQITGSGVYFIRIKTDSRIYNEKVLFVK